MGNQDIIKWIKKGICFTSDDVRERDIVIEKAKMLINRDIPMEPTNRYSLPEEWLEFGICPNCEKEVFNDEHFCHYCGQRLKWDIYDK